MQFLEETKALLRQTAKTALTNVGWVKSQSLLRGQRKTGRSQKMRRNCTSETSCF